MSLSASESSSITARLRSIGEDLGFDRSPMAQTPKRRMIAEDQQLTFRPARNPSADVFSWHNDHHSGKTDTKWWRKPSILVPASIALLLLGFLAGRAVSGLSTSSGRSQNRHDPTLAAFLDLSSPSLQNKLATRNLPYQPSMGQRGSESKPQAEAQSDTLDMSSLFTTQADITADDLSLTDLPDDQYEFLKSNGQGAVVATKSATTGSAANAKDASVLAEHVVEERPGLIAAKTEGNVMAQQVTQKVLAKEEAKASVQPIDSTAVPLTFADGFETQKARSTVFGAQHARIYIAQLPAKYNLDPLQAIFSLGNDQANKVLKSKQAASNLLQNPFGDLVDKSTEMLYTSHPHNLDVLFYTLLQNSSLKTDDPQEADAILVPFWVNKFIKLDQELEKPNRHDLAYGNFWSEADTHLPFLGKKPHLLVVPGQEDSLMSTCGGHGLDFLCHPRAEQFTVLTPEVFVSKAGVLSTDQIAPGLIAESFRPSNRSMAVPDFANIHFPEATLGPKAKAPQQLSKAKTRLVSESFRARAPLRKLLRMQCMKYPDQCVHMEPRMMHSHNSGQFSLAVMRNDQSAWFSLQPPGDSAMRTSLFNSLLAGAIPAIFDSQLGKVLPFSDVLAWEKLFVQIPAEKITSLDTDIISLLKGITDQQRLATLTALHGVQHLMQYSLASNTHLVRFDSLDSATPEDDAFSMSLKAVFRRLCSGPYPPSRCPSSKKLFGRKLQMNN